MANTLQELTNFKNQALNHKALFETALDESLKVIEDPEKSNLEIWSIIERILDVAPFILRLFPELKEKVLAVVVPVNKELTDLINNLK